MACQVSIVHTVATGYLDSKKDHTTRTVYITLGRPGDTVK